MKKSIWQKLTGLSEFELESEGSQTQKREISKDTKDFATLRSQFGDLASAMKEEGRRERGEKGEEGQKREIKEKEEKEEEGKLAVDVYEESNEFIVRATLAGARPEDIDIAVNLDIVTIRGRRMSEESPQGKYINQECYWGKFSRTVILPAEINTKRTQAVLKNGILTITLPKLKKEKTANTKTQNKQMRKNFATSRPQSSDLASAKKKEKEKKKKKIKKKAKR